ncbi:MAG: class IV adenylate cyclase [Spirochaetota bacterium]
MAIEVETKAWATERVEELREQLRRWAEYRGEFDKRDTYFSLPGQDQSLFRIRREGHGNTVTYKRKQRSEGFEVNREHEFAVENADAFIAFSRYLGYEVFIEKHKQGELFTFGDAGIELSHIEGLGWFVEIEILVEHQSEVQAARRRVGEVLQKLDIPEDKIESRYYNEMLKNIIDEER